MSKGLRFIQNDDGVFSEYDDTFDVTIHCQSKEEQDKVFAKLSDLSVASQSCGDCISRAAVLAVAGDSCLDLNSCDATREFCDAINDLSPVMPKLQMISCKDHMPDYYQLVLTFDGEYFCVEQRIPYITGKDGKHIESEWWVDANYDPDSDWYSGLRDGAAVAWMPLPTAPYKEDAE